MPDINLQETLCIYIIKLFKVQYILYIIIDSQYVYLI